MRRARELRDRGRSLTQVTQALRIEMGVPSLSKGTVARWLSDEQAERHRQRSRARNNARATGRLGSAHHTDHFRAVRARALRALGLDTQLVARVLSFDYADRVAPDDVEALVGRALLAAGRDRERTRVSGGLVHALTAAASRELGVPFDAVVGDDRRAQVVVARQVAMAAARALGYSLAAVGAGFARSTSAACRAEQSIAARGAHDPALAAALERVVAAGATCTASAPPAPVTVSKAEPGGRFAVPTGLVPPLVGTYHVRSASLRVVVRRLVLEHDRAALTLVDRGPTDRCVIARFENGDGVLQIAAVAADYLRRVRGRRSSRPGRGPAPASRQREAT